MQEHPADATQSPTRFEPVDPQTDKNMAVEHGPNGSDTQAPPGNLPIINTPAGARPEPPAADAGAPAPVHRPQPPHGNTAAQTPEPEHGARARHPVTDVLQKDLHSVPHARSGTSIQQQQQLHHVQQLQIQQIQQLQLAQAQTQPKTAAANTTGQAAAAAAAASNLLLYSHLFPHLVQLTGQEAGSKPNPLFTLANSAPANPLAGDTSRPAPELDEANYFLQKQHEDHSVQPAAAGGTAARGSTQPASEPAPPSKRQHGQTASPALAADNRYIQAGSNSFPGSPPLAGSPTKQAAPPPSAATPPKGSPDTQAKHQAQPARGLPAHPDWPAPLGVPMGLSTNAASLAQMIQFSNLGNALQLGLLNSSQLGLPTAIPSLDPNGNATAGNSHGDPAPDPTQNTIQRQLAAGPAGAHPIIGAAADPAMLADGSIMSKVFVCHYPGCEKTFSRKLNYLSHYQSTHEHKKPFECEICHKFFARHSDRRRHEKSQHSQNKGYICGGVLENGVRWGCGKQFKRKDGLTAHWRSLKAKKKCFENLKDENTRLIESNLLLQDDAAL